MICASSQHDSLALSVEGKNRINQKISIMRQVVSILMLVMCIHICTLLASSSKLNHSNSNALWETERPISYEVTTQQTQTQLSQKEDDQNDVVVQIENDQESKLTEAHLESSLILKTSGRQSKNERKGRKVERKKDRNLRKHKRNKSAEKKFKSLENFGLKQKSCPTVTKYVYKKTAEDVFGETVDVYPVIHIGNLALDQYFYETFCDVEKCECAGVDNTKYKSSCQTTHNYSYARIVKGGEIGWGLIKVRSGCSCVVKEKRRRSVITIADLLT